MQPPRSAHPRTRTAVRAVAGLALLGAVGFAGVLAFAHWPTATRTVAPAADQAALVEAGRYVATAGDCVACHTAPGGKPFAGGLPMQTPIGRIFTTNITPDRETGIGKYSLADFERVMRHGIVPGGTTLFPAMPYPSYARLSDDDVRALYAYFMQGVAPVHEAKRDNEIAWPLSMRWPLAVWRKLFAPDGNVPFDAARYPDATLARGAYLVQAAGHCGACHTPRALTLQETTLDEGGADYLAGGQVVDGWFAVNLRGDQADGLGRWSAADIVDTLRSGRNRDHAVIGTPMSDVVVHSLQHLKDADLAAVAAYLKTLGPGTNAVASYQPDPTTADDLRAGRVSGRGAELYVDNCAACHRTGGGGVPGAFPAMAGNPSVLAANPVSLVRLLLAGGALPTTRTAPSMLGMPAFDQRLSDAETAQLLTFLRNAWGNRASEVTAAMVGEVRTALRHEREGDDHRVQREATLPRDR